MRLTRRDFGGAHRYGRRFEAGEHSALVLKAHEATSDAGNAMLVLVLGFPGPEGGVKVDHYVVTHFDHLVENLLACLAPEHLHSWRTTGACDLEPAALLGRECQILIEAEEWRGQLRPRVRRLLPF